jgi:PAS domain S-box-containing protein
MLLWSAALAVQAVILTGFARSVRRVRHAKTELKTSRHALDEADRTAATANRVHEEQLDLALWGGNLGAWDWNVTTGEVFFDQRWCTMLGYVQEEIAPHLRSWEALVHPEDMPWVQRTLAAHLNGETEYYEAEYRIRHKSGSWSWILDKGRVVERAVDGTPLRAAGIHQEITARKELAEAHRSLADQQRAIVDALPAQVALLDAAGVIVAVNRRWREFAEPAGAADAPAAAIGCSYFEVCEKARGPGAKDAAAMAAGIRSLAHGQLPQFSYEYSSDAATGTAWYRAVAMPLSGGNGLIVMHLDMTERKRAEDQLRRMNTELEHRVALRTMELEASEANWRAVVQITPIGIALWEPGGTILEVNQAVLEITGRDAADLLETNAWRLIAPERMEQARGTMEGLLRAGTAVPLETVFVRPDGQRVSVRIRSRLIERGGGSCVLSTIGNLTELETARQLFQDVIEAVPDGVVVSDGDGRIIFANPGISEVLGYERDELVGLPVDRLVPERYRAGHHGLRGGYHRSPTLRPMGSGRLLKALRKDGSEVSVEISLNTVHSTEHGRLVISAIRDVTERHRAQEMLHAANEAVSSSVAAIGFADLEGRLTYANAAFVTLWGFGEAARVMGREIVSLWSDSRAAVEAIQAVHEHGAFVGELEARREDGSVFEAQLTMNVVHNDAGQPLRLMGTFIDVSAMRRSQVKMEEAQRIARVGSWEFDLLRNELVWSAQVLRIFEIDSERLGGSYEEFLRRVHPDDRKAVTTFYSRSISTRTPYDFTHRVRMPDGRVKWVHERCETYYAPDGTPLRSVGTSQDVTEMHHAEAALRKSEGLLRAVVRGAPLVIFATDREGVVTLSDGRALELLNLKPGEAVGRSVFELFSTVPHVAENIRLALTGQTVSFTSQISGMAFEALYAPLQEPDGSIAGVVGVAFDVTERDRLEKQLLQAQRMEAVGRLAGGVAHDFNNLLMIIRGQSELLLAQMAGSDARRLGVEEIHAASERAAGLTRQLLTFSRRQPAKVQRLDLNAAIEEAHRMLSRVIGEDVEIQISLAPDSLFILGDRGQVDQVLMNLAINARDAMPGGGMIRILTRSAPVDKAAAWAMGATSDRYAVLEVRDTGMGMTAETKARVFEPFFTTKGPGQGTGLGLSTVYGIVQQCGGGIEIESEPGQGATFRIYFPLLEPEQEPKGIAPPVAAVLGGQETILVVEDEAAVLRLSGEYLRLAGYTVHEASSAASARAVVASLGDRLDLIVTDVIMPGGSGPDLAKVVQGQFPRLKVLFISGYTAGEMMRAGISESAVLIDKPFAREALLSSVRRILDS